MTTSIALRPYLEADAPLLVELFRASVEELASEDYDANQIDAWLTAVEDEAAFAKKLSGMLTLIALFEGEIAGFAALAGKETIDMLYVLPEAARQGVATTLVTALEKLAAARGAAKLTVDASDTAEPFFKARGYVPERRNTIMLADTYIGNTTMAKKL